MMLKTSHRICLFFFLTLCVGGLSTSCTNKKEHINELSKEIKTIPNDFSLIKKKGTLTVITLSSSTSYFIYKDEPMGYNYDFCKDFCTNYGLKLNVKVAENSTRLIQMLENGEGDLVAYPVPIRRRFKDSLIYCGLKQTSRQVLVQRATKQDQPIRDVTQLIGEEVYIKENTKYHQRLQNLNAELGGGIKIKDIAKDTVTSEDLIRMVSKGKIKYTVSDENVARLNKTYYRNIDVSVLISFEQPSSWVVRKNSPQLAQKLDEWFKKNASTPIYKSITKKYFELSKFPYTGLPVSDVVKIPKGHVSPYDEWFKEYAKPLGYDWRLLAAIAYQESKFHTNLTSWSGATGLMGLMPRTARSLGLSNEERSDPELSIKAAVGLLRRLDKMFSKIEDKDERIKFVLASYNGGNGHINDAQALARKYGQDPYKWEGSVCKYIDLKSNPEYYNDPVCKNGYFRGDETINYVDQVLANWKKYQNKKETKSSL